MQGRILFVACYLLSFLASAQKIPSFDAAQGNGFLENKGQIVDQNYSPNPAVKYLLCTPGFNIQLKQTGFSYDTYTDEGIVETDRGANLHLYKDREQHKRYKQNYHRVDIELIGCNPNAEIITEGQSTEYFDYFTPGTPQGGVSFVHQYQVVTYRNIYPNIDLVFFAKVMEYNFIVHPGGNVSDIKLQYSGANSVTLKNNALVVNVNAGEFTENIPYSYIKDTKEKVNVSYNDNGNGCYGFNVQHSTFNIGNRPCSNTFMGFLLWWREYFWVWHNYRCKKQCIYHGELRL